MATLAPIHLGSLRCCGREANLATLYTRNRKQDIWRDTSAKVRKKRLIFRAVEGDSMEDRSSRLLCFRSILEERFTHQNFPFELRRPLIEQVLHLRHVLVDADGVLKEAEVVLLLHRCVCRLRAWATLRELDQWRVLFRCKAH